MASPKQAEALIQQGVALQQRGDLEGAARHFAKALSNHPDHPEALWLAGMAELQRGRVAEGTRHMERLVRVQPKLPDAHHALGKARQMQGRVDDAVACFRHALGLAANHAPSLVGLGSALLQKGDAAGAVEPLQRAASLAPRSGEPRYRLGLALHRLGRMEGAVQALEAAVPLMPGDPNPLFALANALVDRGNPERAAELAARLTGMQPDNAAAWSLRGTALLSAQRADEARECFEKSNALSPGHPAVLCGLCNVYRMKGEFDKAYDFISPLLAQPDPDVQVIVTFAGVAPSLGKEAEAARLVEAAVTRPGIARDDLRMLYFFAGELNDKAGDHDRAFEMYDKGNGIASGMKYVPEEWEREVDKIIGVWGEKGFPSLPRAAFRTDRPVLIVGMPRSGTSLLEQILSSHPQVAGAGERPDIMLMPARMMPMSASKIRYPECVRELSVADLDGFAREYDGRLAEVGPHAARVTDKMPHNFVYLGLINLLLPEARVIHIMRDPVDTCVSNYFQDFANPYLSYSQNLAHLGHHYRQYERLMAHWRTVLDMPFLEVRYEDLVADQERVSRQVIDFVGLEWDDACLQFHKNRREVFTASYAQVRNPIYKKSVERWRRYEKHLGPLLEALGIEA